MKRRHQRRAVLAGLSLITALTPVALAPVSTASAAPGTAPRLAGYGKVVARTPLNMRVGPSSAYESTGQIQNGGNVGIMCHVLGQTVAGPVRTTGLWDRLTNGRYVSDAYISRPAFRIPVCTDAPATGSWTLPVSAGLVSGFRTSTRPSHDGVDLGAARYTPIRSAAAGTVIRVVCNVSTNNCDVDGNRTLGGCGWYAEVLHAGSVVTRYCHMVRRPSVTVGQTVARGQLLGYVGSSGSSSGPHLHFEIHTGQPATRANAVSPIAFLRARGLVIR